AFRARPGVVLGSENPPPLLVGFVDRWWLIEFGCFHALTTRCLRGKIQYEVRSSRDRLAEIDGLGAARASGRLQGMITRLDPMHLDMRRKTVGGNLLGGSKRISRSLNEERWCRQALQVLRVELLALSRRVERIPKADEPARPDFIGDHARDAAAERFAADHEPRAASEARDDLPPGFH